MTLIANLLLMVMKKGLTRSWSFSGLATMMRITLMYYVDFYSLFNHPEKDWETLLDVNQKEDYQPSIFLMGLGITKCRSTIEYTMAERHFLF